MKNNTIYLHDYQPTNFALITVHLDFELFEDEVLLSNQMLFQRRSPGELRLSGDDLELVSVQLNTNFLSPDAYRLEDDDLMLDDCPDEFLLTIVTRIRPKKNTQLSGLYRSKDLFCTQCEPEGFRRMTYFYDRPDVLAIYTTRISANAADYPVLLANGNLIDAGVGNDGRHWVVWQDPFKKPSYLFALVAGQLDCAQDEFITSSGKRIELRIYVEPGNVKKCMHAMASLKKAMRWDEVEFGREYDLSTFMIVAVSDFNMGAMENKGLNIFNAKYILASPDTATDADYAGIESVIAHEYFHNWTGNRVTCRDWFQLSLKEGLTVFRDQEFSRDMNSRDVNRIKDVKVLRTIQFPEDASRMAHPVQPASYQEISNFYTPTIYNKGAEVIRMQRVLLGKVGFRRGMDLYFERHDGQAVTIDDFVAAMEDANGVDFSQFKHWYHQAGTPHVEVQSSFDNGRLTLVFKQTCAPTPECQQKKPFHIPIRFALFNEEGQRLPLSLKDSPDVVGHGEAFAKAHGPFRGVQYDDEDPQGDYSYLLELTKAEQTFYFDQLPEKPIVSLLRGFSAPIQLASNLDEKAWLSLLRYETDGFAKWQAAQNIIQVALLASYHGENKPLPISLLNAYRQILQDDSLDRDLRAELLMLPTFDEVANLLTNIDVTRLEDVRNFVKNQLGQALYQEAHDLYTTLWREEDHAMHGQAYARRKLRLVCLRLMMNGRENDALAFCRTQFTEAKTMTDQVSGLALLASCQEEQVREQILEQFYRQWQHDDLVIDKWFTVQAAADLPDVLQRVRGLLSHPAFHLKNPNRVRALVTTFCQQNPRYFHAIDGSGYQFLIEQLIEIDRINPQLAARLAVPFTRWERFDHQRQVLMKDSLEKLDKMNLSKELTEVVLKSLAHNRALA